MVDLRVSVLLPVFNAESHLEQCIDSLFRQRCIHYEIVAVDDGSDDASGSMLDLWAERDSRVRVFHRPHRGLVDSLNFGLRECRAGLIARIDADDVAHPMRLQEQVAALDHDSAVGVVSCLVRCFPASKIAEGYRLYERWINTLTRHEDIEAARFIESPVAHPSVMMRRDVVEKAGGYRNAGWPEDYDLWLRLIEQGVRFAKLRRFLHFWRDRPDRLSRTHVDYSGSAFARCKAHFLARGPLAEAKQVVVWGAGPTGRRIMRFLEDEGVGVDVLIDIDPKKIGRTVRGAPIVGPAALPDALGAQSAVIVAVASRGARDLIRSRLQQLGLVEGQDFWAVA